MLKRFNSVTLFCLMLALISRLGMAAASPNVRVNSIGYLPNNVKRASVLNAAAASTWNLRVAASNAIVATGALAAAVTDTDTGEAIKAADFSTYVGTGTFYLEIPTVGQSVNFDIQPDVYNTALTVSMMGYYGWRCGTAVNFSYGGNTYSHPACHVGDGYLDYIGSAGVNRDGTRGWHDAGDYNKYIVNAGISVGGLLQAWEDFQPALNGLALPFIPEYLGVIPDYLAEIKWELDWVLKMQYGPADGRVSHKLSATGFDPFEMPEADLATRYYTPYGTAATADFVAMLAKAARIYAPYDAAFAAQCQAAATVSWNYLLANPGDVQANQTGFSTGGYGTTDPSHRLWAAAEMWELTGSAVTLADLESRINAQGTKCDSDWDWGNPKNLGIFTYIKSARAGRNAALVTTVKNAIKAAADARVAGRNSSGYGRTLKGNYYWGSNGSIGRSAMVLHMADLFFPNSAYRDTAVDQLSFLLGRNYYNRSQVTGLGINPPMNPHHRPSGSDGITNPWPGLLVGGPGGHSNSATEWTDVQADYFTNEVAINWNAGLVYNLALFYSSPVPTATSTSSSTSTITGTFTATVTPTGTVTGTNTLSPSPSFSRTTTGTPTPSRSPTSTGTNTASVTASISPSSTLTITPSASPTVSVTPSVTMTYSATDTITPGPSPTQTMSSTVSPSSTISETSTSSSTVTATETPTVSSSITPSYTATLSPSSTATVTDVDTFTSTGTNTSSATVTVSSTRTAVATVTTSATSTATGTFAAATPIVVGGDPKIKLYLPMPQPQAGPVFNFAVLIEGGVADSLELKLYTRAYTLLGSYKVQGSFGPGWNLAVRFAIGDLSNGVYFTRISANSLAKTGKVGRAGRLYVIH